MQKTKTFKIGEYAIGGIIQVQLKGKVIIIKVIDYFTKKEISTASLFRFDNNAQRKIDDYLNELTSSYYADKILNWIKSNVELENEREYVEHYLSKHSLNN